MKKHTHFLVLCILMHLSGWCADRVDLTPDHPSFWSPHDFLTDSGSVSHGSRSYEGYVLDLLSDRRSYEAQQDRYVRIVRHVTDSSQPFVIPNIVHTVWLSQIDSTKPERQQSTVLPEPFLDLLNQCHSVMPDSRFILWVNKSVSNVPEWCEQHTVQNLRSYFQLQPELWAIYQHYMSRSNFGAASDIVRLVVLYLMGGIYRDVDIRFCHSLLPLRRINFFTGFENFDVCLCNALIGSIAGHTILQKMIEHIVSFKADPAEGMVHRTLKQTGPLGFSKVVLTSASEEDGLFPPYTFFNNDRDDKRAIATHEHAVSWVPLLKRKEICFGKDHAGEE